MRRQILLASVGALAIAGSAFAADLPSRAPPPAFVPPPPLFTWTGLYVGAQIGYAFGSDAIDVQDYRGGVPTARFNPKPRGVIGGAHVGYNLQFGHWVVGLEGSVDGTGLTGTSTDIQPAPPIVSIRIRSLPQGSIRGRIGFALDRVLIYGTGGAAFAGITHGFVISGVPIFGGAPFSGSETDTRTRTGFTIGGGIEYALTNNWSIRAEYRYSDFGRSTDFPFVAITGGNVAFSNRLKESQIQAGFSYKFSSAAPVVAKF